MGLQLHKTDNKIEGHRLGELARQQIKQDWKAGGGKTKRILSLRLFLVHKNA